MKTIILAVLASVLILGCDLTSEENLSISDKELSFKKYKDLSMLKSYTKVSDTGINIGEWRSKYGVLVLNKADDNLVVFSAISYENVNDRTYHILDTIHIENLDEGTHISVGYCKEPEGHDQEIIAILKSPVDETAKFLSSSQVIKAWKADMTTETIIEFTDVTSLDCLNELQKIPITTVPD